MNADVEMTIREGSIYALAESKKGIEHMKSMFKEASDLFDAGKDQEGFTLITDKIIPMVNDLNSFCIHLLAKFDDVISLQNCKDLVDKNERMNDIVESLTEETEMGNFTEVGDILRFDFYDLLNEVAPVLRNLIEDFKSSDRKDLENY